MTKTKLKKPFGNLLLFLYLMGYDLVFFPIKNS